MTVFVIFHQMNEHYLIALIIDHVISGLQMRKQGGK